MTPEEARKRVAEHREVIALYKRLAPVIQHIAHITTRPSIFVKHGDIETRRAAMVKLLGGDKLLNYYAGANGDLAVEYRHECGLTVTYFDPDAAGRLEKISGGKCRLTTTSEVKEVKTVVCERGNNES